MAKIFILKSRPSIYGDFIKGFWLKLGKDFRKGLIYVFTNPIVELLYGFSYLWITVFVLIEHKEDVFYNQLVGFSSVGIILFLLTSFKKTRFLGEPQRYAEFFIPFYSVMSIDVLNSNSVLMVLLFNFILIMVPKYFLVKEFSKNGQYEGKSRLMNTIQSLELKDAIGTSNDHNLAKTLFAHGIKVCRPDYSIFYGSERDFNKSYFENDHGIISPKEIEKYIVDYELSLVVVNNQIYKSEEVQLLYNWKLMKRVGHYCIYQRPLLG